MGVGVKSEGMNGEGAVKRYLDNKRGKQGKPGNRGNRGNRGEHSGGKRMFSRNFIAELCSED